MIEESHDQIYIFKSALWLCECNESRKSIVYALQAQYRGPMGLTKALPLSEAWRRRKISFMVGELPSQNKNYFN